MKDRLRESKHKDDREERRKDREDRHNREKRHKDDKEQKRNRKQRSSSREPKEKKYKRSDVSPGRDNRADKTGTKVENEGAQEKLSLSIEETNKLRAKLGLKPLTVDDNKEIEQKGEPITTANKPDIHVPAVNIGVMKKTEEIREKLLVIKEKRRLEQNLFKAKPLAEDGDETTAAWVERTRMQEAKKKEAEERAKILDQMDEEFGVADLVEKEFAKEDENAYRSNDLKGLKIEHSSKDFKEGSNVILTLKDKGVLDDEDDVLVNINMVDDEKALQNIENKKNKPGYNPYDEPEYDQHGNLKIREILDKYDDEIRGGPKREYFMIGNDGRSEIERKRDGSRPGLINESLQLPELLLASDFYTKEEMVIFGKRNKNKKKILRKRVKVTANDLLASTPDDESPKREEMESGSQLEKHVLPSLDKIKDRMRIYDEDDMLGPLENLSAIEDRTWLDLELASVKPKPKKIDIEDILSVKQETAEDAGTDVAGSAFYMNSTAEFCRSLGDSISSSAGPNPLKDEDMDVMQSGADENVQTGWQSVEVDERPVDVKIEDNAVLDDEPIIDQGLGAALKLASKKGYLESLVAKKVSATHHSKLEALSYSIEDKKADDLDDKYSGRRNKYSGGSGGPIVEFKEKEGYKPKIKLEYVDDQGREMSKKEAFRYLSHKFHGKGSGKKKLEKRMKKAEEDSLMRSMSSTDTPLNTVQLLQEKQKANKQAFVILSGGKGLITNTIMK